jgi:hypothetical protein
MLINLSNHPSADWPENQLEAASVYGMIKDLDFPAIDPNAETCDVVQLTELYEVKIRKLCAEDPDSRFAVHLMGEMTFCFGLVSRLQKIGITCLASTTRRQTVNHPNGSKISKFAFVGFREYPRLD